MNENEERRNYILIKGLRLGCMELRKCVQGALRRIDAKVEIMEVRWVSNEGRGAKQMALVKLKNRDHKREIMTKKKELHGSSEKIEDDMTWGERKMQFMLRKMKEEERRKGRETWVKYKKIRIEDEWWKWKEEG